MQMDIAQAKAILALGKIHHEHDDSILIAYQWLDAQWKTIHPTRLWLPLKHVVENWGGRYVSQWDVEVAALMHPDIIGVYPYFNLARRLTLPSASRLEGIATARTQRYKVDERAYSRKESD